MAKEVPHNLDVWLHQQHSPLPIPTHKYQNSSPEFIANPIFSHFLRTLRVCLIAFHEIEFLFQFPWKTKTISPLGIAFHGI